MEGEQQSTRGARGGGRGQRHGRGRGRGGRAERGGFGGSLTNLPGADGEPSRGAASGVKGQERQEGSGHLSNFLADGRPPAQSVAAPLVPPSTSATDAPEAELCFICAEPVQLYSVAPCNHRTCHVCAVRLRALYKKKECTFCKVSLTM